MNPLLVIGYVVDVLILLTYARLALTGDSLSFNLANALGGPVLLVVTIATVGWQPLLVLTIAFTLVGVLGVVRALREPWFPTLDELNFPPARKGY
jgi:hypothetical protein